MSTQTVDKVRVLFFVIAMLCLGASSLSAGPESSETDPAPACGENVSEKAGDPESGSAACEPVADLDPKGGEDPSDVKPGAGKDSHQKTAPEKKSLPQCSDPLYAEANPGLCF